MTAEHAVSRLAEKAMELTASPHATLLGPFDATREAFTTCSTSGLCSSNNLKKKGGALDGRRIGEALVLVFNTAPFKRPIRPHRYVDYVDILADWAKKRAPAGGRTPTRAADTY